MGNSWEEGRGYTKTSLNSRTCLKVARPRKSIPTLCPQKRIALGVLTQRLGSEPQPVAYLSKRLNPTAPVWPPCLRNLAAIAVLIGDSLKLSFRGKLTIFTSCQLKKLLNGRGHLWMSDQKILRYQVVLMENPGLTISPCEVLNPATLLRALSPFTLSRNLGPLDKTLRGIVRRSSD